MEREGLLRLIKVGGGLLVLQARDEILCLHSNLLNVGILFLDLSKIYWLHTTLLIPCEKKTSTLAVLFNALHIEQN